MSSYYRTIFIIKAGSSLILNTDKDHFLTNMIIYQCLIEKLIYLAHETKSNMVNVLKKLS